MAVAYFGPIAFRFKNPPPRPATLGVVEFEQNLEQLGSLVRNIVFKREFANIALVSELFRVGTVWWMLSWHCRLQFFRRDAESDAE